MRSSAALLLMLLCVHGTVAEQYRLALPGYRYEFPRDNFNHPNFETEWWYYTGNLKSADGHRFGFELTFFRQGLSPERAQNSDWALHDLYLAHLALSDISGGNFYHTERTNRAGPGIAGASEQLGRIWNGNWQIEWHGNRQQLYAVCDRFRLEFTLDSRKPPVIHGVNGISQKAAGIGHASHYISLTQLDTRGAIELNGKSYQVDGTSWMDHEFFTSQLTSDQVGWNWLSLQLDDNTELMLFTLRRKDGTSDPFSAGTYVDAHGNSTHLSASDFSLEPLDEFWTSPTTHATYPEHWRLSIPSLQMTLEITTPLKSQEIAAGSNIVPAYWEGAIDVTGTRSTNRTNGVGYLEMTGYAGPVRLAR